MKGLILCAGRGTRLYPLTHTYPKTLIPVANIPILQLCIKKLLEQEIDDIGIVIHHSQHNIIRKHIGTGEQWGIKLTYIYQAEPKGIADAVNHAKCFINEDSFLLLLGDNLITESFSILKELIASNKSHAALLLTKVKNPQDYGIAEVSDHQIVSLKEKPLHSKSNLAIMGAYAFTSLIFKGIASISASPRGEYEITDAIQWLIDEGYPVSYHITDKQSFDVGTLERWLNANRWMLNNMKASDLIDETSLLENCKIVPPVAIGPGCELKNSVIGPHVSIGAGARIEECQIQNSIILNEVHMKQIPFHIKDTIIGFHSVIAGLHSGEKVTDQ